MAYKIAITRSVRPSNFLLDEADHVYLTDICSNVVMKDVQIKTRSSAGWCVGVWCGKCGVVWLSVGWLVVVWCSVVCWDVV